MAASIRRSRSRWYIRITGKRGEPDRLIPKGGYATKAEAERELKKVQARLVLDEHVAPPAPVGSLPFRSVAERWKREYMEVHVTANTRRTYESDIRALVAWYGDLPIGRIDASAVSELVAALSGAGASPQTIRHRTNRLRQVLRWGFEMKLLPTAPPTFRAPRVKRQSEPMPLRPAELDALLAESPEPWGALFATLALHGLRPGEARFLRWGDLTRGRLHVRGTLDSVQEAHDPKADSIRSLPLDPYCLPLLRARPMAAPADPVFPFLGFDFKAANRELRAALVRAGVPGASLRILYDLRHTFATLSILQGVGPATLAKRMGNSVKVCMDTYVQFFEDLAPDAQVVVSAVLPSLSVGSTVGSNAPAASPVPAPEPWEPLHIDVIASERETGLEPATLSLEG